MTEPAGKSASLELRIHRRLKALVLGNPLLRRPASAYLGARLRREYAALVDGYARRAREGGLAYDAALTQMQVRARLSRRGAAPSCPSLACSSEAASSPSL